MITDRQKYKDIHRKDARGMGFDTVQLKFDGIWGRLVVEGGHGKVYSRNGALKAEKTEVKAPDGTYIGEFMYGSNWSLDRKLSGQFFAFDCIEYQGEDLREKPWLDRVHYLYRLTEFNEWAKLAEHWPIQDADRLWEKYVEGLDYEGLVFRAMESPWDHGFVGRHKRLFTMDYVVMGMTESELRPGNMKGLVLGLYVKGKLTRCNSCGGGFLEAERRDILANPEKYIGRVIEISGNKIFAKGAMRHPNVVRDAEGQIKWREDKSPEECILP